MSDTALFIDQVRQQVAFSWHPIEEHPGQVTTKLTGTHPEYPNLHLKILQGVQDDPNYVESHLTLVSGCGAPALASCELNPAQALQLTSNPNETAAVGRYLQEHAAPVGADFIERFTAAGRTADVIAIESALAQIAGFAGAS
ncbi:MAG: hypothetical protein WAU06_05600 [Candidatus Nanopelagicales bacterium]